jgi:hypothetical protein
MIAAGFIHPQVPHPLLHMATDLADSGSSSVCEMVFIRLSIIILVIYYNKVMQTTLFFFRVQCM